MMYFPTILISRALTNSKLSCSRCTGKFPITSQYLIPTDDNYSCCLIEVGSPCAKQMLCFFGLRWERTDRDVDDFHQISALLKHLYQKSAIEILTLECYPFITELLVWKYNCPDDFFKWTTSASEYPLHPSLSIMRRILLMNVYRALINILIKECFDF